MPAPSSSAPVSGSASRRPSELQLKLTWLTIFRTIATTLLLGAIAGRLLSSPDGEELSRADSLSFALIVGVYLLTLVYGLVLRRGFGGKRVAVVQLFGDVMIASALVYLTGGIESPFTFTYSLAVIAASILLQQQGALIAAATSSLAFSTLCLAIRSGLLQLPAGAPLVSARRLIFLVLSNTLAQFLIAALASYLSRQLSAAGGQLSAREADLQQLVGLQNQIVTAMPSGLLTCEADGKVTFINPAAAEILHLESNERDQQIETLIPDVLKLRPRTRRAEMTVLTRRGSRILGLAVTPLEGKRGSLLIVFQDLTDLRRIEGELHRIDHLASLGKLSAQLAHEIRNPLASMRGAAQLLAGEAGAEASATRLAGILIRESDRLSGLVDDFLRFARPPPPAVLRQSLKALVADTVEMLRADPMTLGIEIEEVLPDVWGWVDEGQLRQVLINLLRNAFAAAGKGGKVRVSLSHEGSQARIKVWDSAGSIPRGDLDRIFEPFFSTKEGGTGLGLSTAHSIVRAHGGTIQVTSSREQGTEFEMGLPDRS